MTDPIEGQWLRLRSALEHPEHPDQPPATPEQLVDAQLIFYAGARAALGAVFKDGMAGPQSFGFAVVLDRFTKARSEINAFEGVFESRMAESRPLFGKKEPD